MTCQACGGQMPSDANFCPSCGAKVTREAQSPPSVSSADASDVEATAMMSASELEELLAAAAAKTGESAPETPAPKARSERRVSVTSGTIDLDGGGSSASAEAEPPPETSQSAAMTQYEMEVLEGVDESGVGPVIRRPGSTDAGMPIPQPVTRQVVAPPGQPETPTKAMDLQGLRDARDRVQDASTRGLDTSGLRKERQEASTEAVDAGNLRRSREQEAATKAADLSGLRKSRETVGSGKPRSPLEMPIVKIGGVQGRPDDAPDPDQVSTRFEMAALSESDIRRAVKGPGASKDAGDDDASQGASSSSTEDESDAEARARKKAFSETQWFMKGAEVDADMLESVDHEDYDHDDALTTGERRKFTLRSDED